MRDGREPYEQRELDEQRSFVGVKRSFLQLRFVFVFLSAAAALAIVWLVREVLLVIFGGILLAVFFCGVTNITVRYTRLPRGWALVTVLLSFALLIIVAVWFLGADLLQQVGELRSGLMKGYDQLDERLRESPLGEYWKSLSEAEFPTTAQVSALAGYISSGIGALAVPLIILVLGLFLSIDPELYQRGVIILVPKEQRASAVEILERAGSALWGWLWGRLFSMSLVGVTTLIGLWLLGVPIALSLALIAFATNFIPYIGPILSALPALLIASTVSPMHAFYILLLYGGIQLVETNLITPLVEQQAVNLPPAFTISAQLISGVLLGPLGVVFATPLSAVVVLLVQVLYVDKNNQHGSDDDEELIVPSS